MKNSFDFSEALEKLKEGRAVTRDLWDGNCVYLTRGVTSVLGGRGRHIEGISDHLFDLGGESIITRHPSITMRTCFNNIVTGWTPSQVDLLAEDWRVVD